jgi:two-component system, chemotaxis family, chemotaxis protein CheY
MTISSFKLLLVDDSAFVRNQIKEILAAANVTILEAEDGSKALDVVALNSDIGLVICDINMPRMDGLAFLTQLVARSPNKKPPCPVVMLTTENKLDRVLEGKKLGATAWLIKPPAPQDILRLIEKFRASPAAS